jgi:asparagine synthase (glutamine-hydrolysing)
MCGICGVYQYGPGEPVRRETLRAMLSSIQHRGPDDEGWHLEPEVGIGSRRLSIIDLAGGAQPIYSEDGSIAVVFNGEIYNYRELASELKKRGHDLRTASDTEVIVHLYEECAEECVQQLRGMFAFALWDKRRQRLFVARDRLGIKPLYYAERGGTLVFGSEIKALLQHPAMTAEPDLQALSHYLSLKYVPAPATMFRGIQALPPAHTLTCDRSGISVWRYWDLSYAVPTTGHKHEAEYAAELEALLCESVSMHLVSDVPFGAFLSGGIDSSLVVAMMSKVMQAPVKTYSVGYDGPASGDSELPYARLAANEFHTDHHEIIVSASDVIDLAEKVVWHLDQPIADPASLPMYMLAHAASREVKMVLVGEGADELFAGYARYAGATLEPLSDLAPAALRRGILAASSLLPGLARPKAALRALCQPDAIGRLVNWFPLFNEEEKKRLLSPEFNQVLNSGSLHEVFAAQLRQANTPDRLARMLYVDTKLWLADDLLARGDKMTMAGSLEARVPFLDHKLVEFAAALPANLKLNGLVRKYLLRQVARKWVPAAIVERKKKGFPVPLGQWFRREARPFVRDLLSPATLRRRGLFDPKYVETLLHRHESGKIDAGALIWGLLNVELWFRQFVDGTVSKASLSTADAGWRIPALVPSPSTVGSCASSTV